MNWLNIHTPFLRSPEFIGCDPVSRAAWLCVFAYCAEQENSGVIRGCRGWKDRQWQQTCGVTLAEVDEAAPLLSWAGNDLVLLAYPHDKEIEVQRMRELGSISSERKAAAARNNGSKGGRPHAEAEKPNGNPTGENPSVTQETQRKPIEGEGEGEGNKKGKGTGKEHPQDPPPTASRSSGNGAGKPESWEAARDYAEEIGMAEDDFEKWFDHFESNGWKVSGKAPMKDWHAALRNGHRRAKDFATGGKRRTGAPGTAGNPFL